jgi:hypothetical protein
VASSPDVARTFYEGAYVEGESVAPTCWSNDDRTPDASVPDDQKQAPSCATCPQNVAGSGQNGSRACRYSRRLAVTLENDPNGGVYQVQLPAQSIFGKPEADGKMPLQAYAKLLVQHKLSTNAVVTEFRFDTSIATPKLTFKPVRPLTKAEWEQAKIAGASPEAQEAIQLTVFQTDKPAGKTEEIFEQNVSQEQAAAVQTEQPAPARRTRAKPAAAPAAAPAQEESAKDYAKRVMDTPLPEEPIDGSDDEEAQLVALQAKIAAKKKAAATAAAEPVVVQSKPDAAPVNAPAGAAAMLSEWDD